MKKTFTSYTLPLSLLVLSTSALSADYYVSTFSELKNRLDNAVTSDRVVLTKNITLLEDQLPLKLMPGVTLDGGEKVYSLSLVNKPLKSTSLIYAGDEAKVVNLKLIGPYLTSGWKNGDPAVKGIVTQQLNGQYWIDVVIEESTISGFREAIVGTGTARLTVTNNNITDNFGDNFGYGIALYGNHTKASIKDNYFDHNRHDIAGNGLPNQEFTAINNTIGTNGTSHSFDMHGCVESQPLSTCINSKRVAGNKVVITGNTFLNGNQSAVVLRGEARQGTFINDNVFTKGSKDPVIAYRWSDSTVSYGKCTEKRNRIVGGNELLVSWGGGAI